MNFDEGFNYLPTESVTLGFQQLIRTNQNQPISTNSSDINSSDTKYFVYPFADKEIIIVATDLGDTNCQFGFKLRNDELYGHVYIDKIKAKHSVEKAFNKSTWAKLKGSPIIHIDSDPIFSTKDAEMKL